ncbi:unnamed protein product, partial [Rotaria sp. Silwood2]
MAWTYWQWVWCNIFISTAIFLFILFVLVILLCFFDKLFFSVVAKLFNIKRCTIDVHHIIRRNSTVNTSSAPITKATNFVSKISRFPRTPTDKASNRDEDLENPVPVRDHSPKKEEEEALQYPSSHPEYKRTILNMYGKFLPSDGVINKISLTIITTIIIAAAIIAIFKTLFLATTAVYRDGPCPNYGPMECFCGNNQTYFVCQTGDTVSFPLDTHSGTCFRWIVRDITTSDVTTQIGVTAGLLTALGSIAESLIRLYLYVLQKRL